MKIITISIRGALILAIACLAFACSRHGAASHQADAATTNAANPNTASAAASPVQSADQNVPRIKAEEAKKMVAEGKAIIIDVRGTDSYKMMHIKGSLDFPLARLQERDFKGLPKDKRIIAVCACGAEQTSAQAATLLQQNGFKDAGALLGGFSSWEAAGGAVERAPAPDPKKKG